MTTYQSKIGLGLWLPIIGILYLAGILLARENVWIGSSLIILLTLFIGHMLVNTYYQVSDQELIVKCGVMSHQKIAIDRIKEIQETNNPISAPAASLDRLLIRYNKYDSVIVSPKNKSEFIGHLMRLNPNIIVRLKETQSHK